MLAVLRRSNEERGLAATQLNTVSLTVASRRQHLVRLDLALELISLNLLIRRRLQPLSN